MIEFLKELVREPENFKKYIIIALKFVLIAIVTSKIYVYFFGYYEPILIGDTNFWHDTYSFFISGKVLIITFLFFGLKYVVFEVFSTIVYAVIYFITSNIKKSKSTFKDASFFRDLLVIFHVIKHNKEKNIIETDRNFNFLFVLLTESNKEEIIKQLDNLKNSYLYEVFNIYSAFTIIYFLILDISSNLFSFLIVLGFLLILTIIFCFQYLNELVLANYDDLVFSLKTLKQIKITKDVLFENKIKVNHDINNTFINFILFKVGNTEIGIEYFLGRKLSSEYINKSNLPLNSKLLLVSSKKLPMMLEQSLKENPNLQIIYFDGDEAAFRNNLESIIFS
jgi:hypothetical protein